MESTSQIYSSVTFGDRESVLEAARRLHATERLDQHALHILFRLAGTDENHDALADELERLGVAASPEQPEVRWTLG